ncbi:MAG: hypothetical protein F6K36_23595 [Symploca sp. SIO3C6]|uniref:Biotin carboxylase n=1 Tax=Symploca sp. SIO1C4 TaxID=2607765 RepID=A0A6B3N5Z4_9CYAN|nr:hypothetical protein [Symploca sp. SIO3C6]NER27000.1 hypothetical protein [Symploca sp. SIO1C4]NET06387.1 hypothetical protein [Symploca sp. SIO2B6]
MRLRSWLAVIAVSFLFWVSTWIYSPVALALIQIKLSDLSYRQCPPEIAQGIVSAGGRSSAAKCFLVSGKAENKSGKTVVNADIFGRIYDANNNPIFQNRNRLGSIEEVPPGVSDFEIRITVAANQPTPLKLKQFKASGFTGRVRR